MMDRLDDIVAVTAPLLRQVDDVLTVAGAPGGHRVWTELRRVRVLPSDAVRRIAALRPAELAEAAPELRHGATQYATLAAGLPGTGDWTGEAADAYDRTVRRFADQLGGAPAGLGDRLTATADLADAMVSWMRRSRGELAATLAEVMSSAEALTVLDAATDGVPAVPEPEVSAAAADIATTVLRAIGDADDRAAELVAATADLAVPLTPPAR